MISKHVQKKTQKPVIIGDYDGLLSGEELLKKLSADLTCRFGLGFSPGNLENMRRFYMTYKAAQFPRRRLGN